MIDLHRSSVQTWECDQMGHMNVQFYVEKALEAAAALGLALGLGPRKLTALGLALNPREQHIRFLRELRPGAPFTIAGGVVAAEAQALTLFLEMRHSLTGVPVATFRSVLALVSRATRAPVALPAEVHAAALRSPVVIPEHGAPRGLALETPRPAPGPEDKVAQAMVETYRGVVLPEHCDPDGHMRPRHLMGRVSDAIPNLLGAMTGRDRSGEETIGGAALEYRFVYREPARAGDVLHLRSGLKSVGAKTYVWCHWLFAAETGACVATSEAVAVAMDLAARKAIAIPPLLKAHLETRIVPGLSV